MQKSHLPYTSKIHKNHKKQLQKSKTFEKKTCKGVNGVRKFTVKSTRNPINGSGAKTTRLTVHNGSKSYVNTTSHIYVAETKSQQREELRKNQELVKHIVLRYWMSLLCFTAIVPKWI